MTAPSCSSFAIVPHSSLNVIACGHARFPACTHAAIPDRPRARFLSDSSPSGFRQDTICRVPARPLSGVPICPRPRIQECSHGGMLASERARTPARGCSVSILRNLSCQVVAGMRDVDVTRSGASSRLNLGLQRARRAIDGGSRAGARNETSDRQGSLSFAAEMNSTRTHRGQVNFTVSR
jgi:hypothetical protein